jgi:lysophospholipase L1-like esterase
MRTIRLLAATLLLATTSPAAAQHWTRSWSASPQAVRSGPDQAALALHDQTLRQTVRLSAGGPRLRLRLSNEFSPLDTTIGAVHVALVDAKGNMVSGSDREVRFGGQAALSIPAAAPLLSDPIDLRVAPLSRLRVSIHFAGDVPRPTIHERPEASVWVAPGDQTGADTLKDAVAYRSDVALTGVEVESVQLRHTVVTLGDSITDGARITRDSARRWPDVLAGRLQAAGMDIGVSNAGISGNRVLHNGAADNALARFDRDVLAVPGASHVVVLEGINDIGQAFRDTPPSLTPEALVGAYRQMVKRAHARGVRILFGTITPYKGAGSWKPEADLLRQTVNRWIMTNKEADGFIDFDHAVADPGDALRMASGYDSGDHLHPNDAGYRAMGESIDLTLFR